MENISDKEVVKKKKRRKRKKSTTVKSTVVKTAVHDKTFDTAKIDKIKEEVSEHLENTKQVPMHVFSIKNLFITILATCLVVLVIVAGYLVGLFESLQNDPQPEIDFGTVNSIEEQKKYVNISDYNFLVPSGFEEVNNGGILKVNNSTTGVNLEIMDVLTEKTIFNDEVVEIYKEDLSDEGYVIYGTYFTDEYDDNFLVYSGVDSLGDELRMVYAPITSKKIAKILVTNEYENISNDVLDTVYEMLNK